MDWSTFKPIETTQSERDFDGFSDWDQFTPIQPKPDQGDLMRGVKESFQQLPQLGYGLIAGVGAAAESAFGEGGIATGIKKAGVKGYEEWGAKIAKDAKPSDSWDYSYDQAKQGNFGALVDWLQHGIGYVGGQALQTLATGGIGAVGGKFVAGTAAKQIAEGMVAKEAANIASTEAAKTLTTEAIAKLATANVASKFATLGQSVALGANAVGMEGGEVFGGLVSENKDRALTGSEIGKAFAASLGAGALEFVGDKVGLDIMLGKSKLLKPAEFMTGKTGRLARGAIAAAGAAPIEAGTEYAQTLAEEYGKGKDPFSPESFAQARDAAALGALGGTVIGGAGGGMRGATPIAEKPQELLQIGNIQDPLIVFRDGTVARRSEVDAYIAGLPEDQRAAVRAKMIGIEPQPVTDPVQPILAAGSADDAIKAAHEAGQAWQVIAPSVPSEDVAMQRQIAQAAANLAERERIVSEREGAARSAARDVRLNDIGQQWQALGITNPQDDLQAQRAGMRPTQDGPTVELQSTAARAIPDRSDITTPSMDDGDGVGVRIGTDDGRLAAGGVDQLGELPTGPVATNELTFPFTKNESGTVLVAGDPAQIRAAFPGLSGVTKFENGKQVGVLFGTSAAPTVIAKLEPSSVKDNPQRTNTEAQAAPVEATTPVRSDAIATKDVPGAGSATVQTVGVDERLIPISKRASLAATAIGRNNTPISDGGKPYRTKRDADAGRKNQPMMRVQRVAGGFALVEKTPAQLAAQEKAAKRLSQPRTSPKGEPIPAHSMIAAIGGLSKQTMADMGLGDNPKVGNRRLFAAAGGLTIEQATERLVEDGYLQEGASHSQAMDLIKRSLTNPQYTPEGTERMAEKELPEREAAFNAEQEAIAELESSDDNVFDINDGDIPWDAPVSNTSTEEAMRALGFTDQEISDAIANETGRQSQRSKSGGLTDEGTTAQAQADMGSREGAPREDQGDRAEGLTSPTREDVIAQQARAEQAEKDKLEADAAAEKKAKAEREQKEIAQRQAASAENFQLGQTAEDSLSGQASIFDVPKDQVEEAKSALDAANVTGKERLDVIKDLRAGALTAQEVKDAYPAIAGEDRNEGTDALGGLFANEPTTNYSNEYGKDLFGNPLPENTGSNRSSRPEKQTVRRVVSGTPKLFDTPAPDGKYYVNTSTVVESKREVGASVVTSPEQAAKATSYLYRSAVERFDAIVTDASGKVLAVVGGFKGAISQASIYPGTIVSEAVRVPGAAHIWFSHNHPSGSSELSNADKSLSSSLADVFRGSGIEPMGLLAVAGNRFSYVDQFGRVSSGSFESPKMAKKVPVFERELTPMAQFGEAVSSPQDAKSVSARYYNEQKGPGILLLDAQHNVAAWIPITNGMRGTLRGGELNTIYRAASQANASAAIIVHGGELDTRVLSVSASENIAAALAKIDVRPLDSINVKTNRSAAESGSNVAQGPLYSRADYETMRQLSRGRDQFWTKTTVTALKAAIKELTGLDGFNKLGRIVATTASEIKSTWEPLIGKSVNIESEGDAGKAQAFYDPKSNTVFLIADHIRAGDETAVLAHELMHKWGQQVLGKDGWDRLHNVIGTWANADKESDEYAVYNYAKNKVAAVGAELSNQELFPYAVEAAIKMGIQPSMTAARGTVARWLESVRQNLKVVWAKITGKPETFKAQDLVNLAFGIAQMENPEYSSVAGFMANDTSAPDRGGAYSRDQNNKAENALRELSKIDDMFVYPKSDKTDMAGIIADNDPGLKFKESSYGNETLYKLTIPNVKGEAKIWVRKPNPYGPSVYSMDLVDGEATNLITERPGNNPEDVPSDTEDVYIDVSDLKEGDYGALIYNIAATYAHNTGRIFIGDPSGLSDIAMRRRLENMISTAIKFGTTDHIAPHPKQVKGNPAIGVPPLEWVYGDSVGNLERMIDVSLQSSKNAGNEEISYEPDTRNFTLTTPSGEVLAGEPGASAERLPSVPGSRRKGWRTAARAAIFNALLREEGQASSGQGRRDGLLERLLSLGNQRNDTTGQIFYSRGSSGAVQGAGAVAPNTKILGETSREYTAEQLRAMKNVGFQVEVPTLKERAQALWKDAGKKLAQGIADQFAPVKELDKNAYGLLRLAKGATGAFEAFLRGGKLKLTDGVYDFDEANKGGVVDRLLLPLQGEHHDFLRWVAASRAERLAGEGKENLFTAQDIADIKTLADGTTSFDYTIQTGPAKGKVTRDRTLIYADANRVFNEFNRNILDLAEQSGLIDGESRKLWEHEFYVPFYRVADEADGGIRGMNIKGGVVRQQAFKQLKGGKNALNADLLDNTLMNWAHLLDASAKNRAAKATIEAAERMGVASPGNQSTLSQMATSINNASGVVWFMDGGQRRFSLVDDPYLMTAITSLEYAGMRNPVMNAMGTMKHWLTVGVTASPFFKVRNLIRDSVQAIGTGNLSFNPAKNLSEGWKLTDHKSDAYFRLLAGGGTIHFGTMMEGSEAKRVQALVESGVSDSTILNNEHKVKAFYRKFIEPGITAYNELGNRGEAINRAALYNQLRKQGLSHADASLQARDLMDFSMQGSFTTIRFLTQVVPFLNARIQGLYKLGKSAKEDPARFGTVLGAATVMSIGLLAAYGDDDDWKKREEWDRNNFWWFKFGGTAFRIPKPFEIGAIATLAERGFELAFDKEMTNKRFMAQVATLLGDNLSMNPVPQLVKPILDVYSNKDSFSGRPIETMGMEKIKSEYRFTDKTSMVARALGTANNAVTGVVGAEGLSPVQIDSMLRGYFGWLGSFIVGASDLIARPAAGQADRPSSDIWKAATGGMVSDLRDAPSRYVSQMYTQSKEIEQAYGTWRALLKEGKTAEAQAFYSDNKESLAKYRNIEAVKRAEARLNERIKMIERSNMDADAKRELIRSVQQQKDRAARLVTT